MNTFHDSLCDKVLQASTRNDNEEKDYLDLALTMSMTDTRLDVVPPNMIRLDRILRPELEEKCKQDLSLSGEMERIKREKSALGEPFTMMRVLVMIYHNLCNERSMLDMYTIRDLTNIQYEEFGDSRVDLFWNKFLSVLSRMNVPLETKHARDCLYHEMKKSKELKIPLREYNKKALEDRTFEDLRTIITEFIHERREESAFKGEEVKKGPPKVHLVLGKGRGKGKGKGKGESRRVTFQSSEDESGNSSGWPPSTPFGPRRVSKPAKKKCVWYQTKWRKGPGCRRGVECKFSHEMCSTREEYDELRKPWALEEHEAYERTKRSSKPPPIWVPKGEKERDVVKLIVEEARHAWQSLRKYEKSKEKKARRKRAKADAKALREL